MILTGKQTRDIMSLLIDINDTWEALDSAMDSFLNEFSENSREDMRFLVTRSEHLAKKLNEYEGWLIAKKRKEETKWTKPQH